MAVVEALGIEVGELRSPVPPMMLLSTFVMILPPLRCAKIRSPKVVRGIVTAIASVPTLEFVLAMLRCTATISLTA